MKSKRILSFILVSCIFIASAFAFQFSPLEQSFSPSGPNSTRTYTMVNDSDNAIAVEITALVRDQDVGGKEITSSAAAYFSIVPSKVILRPQSSQIVRVQYRGPATVPAELPFRIRAEQIPYTQGTASGGQSMFNFLYVYTTSAYVTPSRSVARVEVTAARPALQSDGRQVIELTVANTGTVHQILNGAQVELTDTASRQRIIYEGAALGFVNGMNLLAGKTVAVQIAWPQDFPFPSNLASAERMFTARITYTN